MCCAAKLSARNDGSFLLFTLICITGTSLVSRSCISGVRKPRRKLELEVGTADLKLGVHCRTSESSVAAWDGGGAGQITT